MIDPNLKCSDWAQPYDKWAQISVDATAISSTVLALIQSTADIPVEHNDAYADDSCFEILPAPGAKGICMGAGAIVSAIDTGAVGNVPAAPWTGPKAAKTQPVQSTQATTTTTTTASTVTTAAPAGSDPKTAVKTEYLNVRDKPGLSTNVIGKLNQGDVVDVTGKSADGVWFQIKYKDGSAWIYAAYTLPNAAAKAAPVAK